jgi:hypothetical protein
MIASKKINKIKNLTIGKLYKLNHRIFDVSIGDFEGVILPKVINSSVDNAKQFYFFFLENQSQVESINKMKILINNKIVSVIFMPAWETIADYVFEEI